MSETKDMSGEVIAMWVFGTIFGLIILVILLWYIRKWIQGGQFTKDVRIDGKVVIVTGCNTGIGKETVLDLAKRGAKIHMACRNTEKCEEARLEIIKKTGNNNIVNRELDLCSFESIRAFAKNFQDEEPKLDILINNAGVMACPLARTKDGMEMQIGVNHMGHFLLTNLLLDSLKAAAPSRIVVLSSLAHIWGQINKDDLNSEKGYNKFKAYSQSKLANVLFTRELAKRLENTGVTVNCCHPGVVKTDLGRHMVKTSVKDFFSPAVHYFFKTPEAGAQTSLALALDPDLAKVTGKYFSDCKEKKLNSRASDDETAAWLWKASEAYTGLRNEV